MKEHKTNFWVRTPSGGGSSKHAPRGGCATVFSNYSWLLRERGDKRITHSFLRAGYHWVQRGYRPETLFVWGLDGHDSRRIVESANSIVEPNPHRLSSLRRRFNETRGFSANRIRTNPSHKKKLWGFACANHSERAKGVGKASCRETVVQKVLFGESLFLCSLKVALKTSGKLRIHCEHVAVHCRVLDDCFSAQRPPLL